MSDTKKKHILVDPQIHKKLKLLAVKKESTIEVEAHEILTRELNETEV